MFVVIRGSFNGQDVVNRDHGVRLLVVRPPLDEVCSHPEETSDAVNSLHLYAHLYACHCICSWALPFQLFQFTDSFSDWRGTSRSSLAQPSVLLLFREIRTFVAT